MLGRIIEIADDRRHLTVDRGLLVVEDRDGKELGRIPLDDICAVIANARGITYSHHVLVNLAERGAPLVVCGKNHNAVGVLLTLDGNHEQARRMEAQLEASLPTRKRLWAEIVRAKLQQQAFLLNRLGLPDAYLVALVRKVKSGDSSNLEAQGAQRYWSVLFGASFRRNRSVGGVNAMLNYGYTVLRAVTIRAIVAAGLHPSIGLHHSNDRNPARLADDLMEPFRPLVDEVVKHMHEEGYGELTPDTKRSLVKTLYASLEDANGASPAIVRVQNVATSLAQVYLGERRSLDLAKWRLVAMVNGAN